MKQSSGPGPGSADLAAFERFARDALTAAGSAALEHFRQQPEVVDKAGPEAALDPVTLADRAVEDHLRAAIQARHPDHGVFGEEGARIPARGDFAWTIDPIEGTRGFIGGFIPFHSNRLALQGMLPGVTKASW